MKRATLITATMFLSVSTFANVDKLADKLESAGSPFDMIAREYAKAKPVTINQALQNCFVDKKVVDPGYRETTHIRRDATEVVRSDFFSCIRVIETTNAPPLFPVQTTLGLMAPYAVGYIQGLWQWNTPDSNLKTRHYLKATQVGSEVVYTSSDMDNSVGGELCKGWLDSKTTFRELNGSFIIKHDRTCASTPALNGTSYIYRFKNI